MREDDNKNFQEIKKPFTPDSILKEGEDFTISVNPYTQESGKTRKGTIAATLNNVARLNLLLAQPLSLQQAEEIGALIKAIEELIPSLRVVGMFDFFEPIYWIGEGEQLGRIIVILLYFKHYPQELTPPLRQKIESLTSLSSSPYDIKLSFI